MFVFLMIASSLCSMGQDNKGETFFNADGSQNAYFIDTVHIDSLVIVRSIKNGHLFAIRNPSEKSLKGKIWNLPETYLYDSADIFYSWFFKDLPDNAIPNELDGLSLLNGGKLIKFIPSSNAKRYEIVVNYTPPKYYWLVMIRGNAYNYTVRSVLDSGYKRIKFKDEKAYYKLLIPVW